MSWTQERINTLVELWMSGKSASIVARELGNVSRNAVIGKVHRLGIANRTSVKKTAVSHSEIVRIKNVKSMKVAKKRMPAFRPTVREADDVIKIKSKKIIHAPRRSNKQAVLSYNPQNSGDYIKLSLLELRDNTCRWPSGDPRDPDFHFCGCTTQDGSSYCAYHSTIAYTQTSKRENKQYIVIDTKPSRNEEIGESISLDVSHIDDQNREHINYL